MVVIGNLHNSPALKAAGAFYEALQLHLQLADQLEQLCVFCLAVRLVLAFLAPNEQLAENVKQLPLPRDHLDRVDGLLSAAIY